MRFSIKKVLTSLLLFITLFSLQLQAEDQGWPKEMQLEKYKFVIYQPQPESLEGNSLKVLTAISLVPTNGNEPIFGAMWFEAKLSVDKSQDRAILDDFSLSKVYFAHENEDKAKKLSKLLTARMPQWSFDISYQRLLSSLEVANMQKKESVDISTDSPHIIVTQKPTVLISIDGEPRLKPIKDSTLLRVINTPYTIIMDPSNSTYYLNADKDVWYSSLSIDKGWKVDKRIPDEVKKQQPKADEESENSAFKAATVPDIIVSTQATELISCSGEPEYSPIGGTNLMYVSNTESDLFIDLKTRNYYLLLAGRWYETKNLNKEWSYLPSTKLPADFAKIPPDSDSSNVRYAIAGTQESKDAVIDAQVPQTASVNRKTAKLVVVYDGAPAPKKIEGTKLSYMANSETPVVMLNQHYYACDNAIWFEAENPYGVWEVATSVPAEIYSIPPSSPVYNITFVKIYKYTDETVYLGYTAGYTNTYVYNTTIVYGTGYSYRPWYGNYYYPYPATWGYHMRWNPYYGWGIGMSYSSGPFTFAVGGGGWYGHGYWGPASYYRYGSGYRRGYSSGYRQGYTRGKVAANRPKAGNGTRVPRKSNNVYKSKVNRDRVKDVGNRGLRESGSGRLKQNLSNNVYADRSGNVHRKTEGGWEQRKASGWDKSRQTNPSRQNNLDRSAAGRSRGDNLSKGSFSGNRSNFSGSRGGFSGGRGSGGRGGGGRRR